MQNNGTDSPGRRIGYLVNQYPKVSHTFIRREIHALESLGSSIQRFALRGWKDVIVDDEDISERQLTHYLLQGGAVGLLTAIIWALATRPVAFARALALTMKLGRGADRPLPIHLIYLAEACALARQSFRLGVRHIHAHFGSNPAEVVALSRALGGPTYSFTVHGPEEFDNPRSLKLREKIAGAAFVVAISSFGKSQLQRWIPFDHWGKIQVVHCGVDASFFAEHGVAPSQRNRLVNIGRLSEQKGQLLLIDACRRVVEQGHDFDLVIIGDGEMRGEIETAIADAGLGRHVTLAGWQGGDAVKEELLNARALVLPSFAEGLPVVLMEAMALERIVISTYVAGIPELVRPGIDGFLVPAADAAALADAITAVLKLDVESLSEMGQGARMRAAERHSIATEAAKLGRLFDAVLAPAGAIG